MDAGKLTGESAARSSQLDPTDWEAFQRWMARAVADAVVRYQGLHDSRSWTPMPESSRSAFNQPLPHAGDGFESVYQLFEESIAPFTANTPHQRNWGWVHGCGLPVGAIAEFLAATLNANCSSFDQSPAYVELQVLQWLKELLGYAPDASGLLVTGCSTANLIGLAVARHARGGIDLRRAGMRGAPRFAIYASREVHSSVIRAVEVLGFGTDAISWLDTDERLRIAPQALRERIKADRARGMHPLLVVATAGTVNTGAIDPLAAIADICAEENLWLHVDGAFGALAWLDPRQRPLLNGMQRADSIAFDGHKWLHQPYDLGCILVRDATAHREAFEIVPKYLAALPGSISDGPVAFNNLGLELSRGFRALKLWFTLKTHGAATFADAIAANIDLAGELARRVAAHPRLDLYEHPTLNVVCFRFKPERTAGLDLDALNKALLVSLQRQGFAVPSSTELNDCFWLRVAITNHRSSVSDTALLVEAVDQLGSGLVPPAAA